MPSSARAATATQSPTAGCSSVVTQLACELGAELAVLRVQDVLASVLDGDARGREAVGLERAERVGVRLVPAQGLEVQRDLLLKESVPGKGARSARRRCSARTQSSVHHLLSSRKPWRRIQAAQEKVTSGFRISAAPCAARAVGAAEAAVRHERERAAEPALDSRPSRRAAFACTARTARAASRGLRSSACTATPRRHAPASAPEPRADARLR